MNKIFIITGPAGVGKSTISKKIAEHLPKSVLLEGDEIYHIVVGSYTPAWKDGNHLDFFLDNAISLIKNSIDYGYDVIFNYIISPHQLNKIKETFPTAEIKFICLMTDEKTIVYRDNLRPEDCRMGERSIILLNEFKNKSFNQNNILYTTDLSVDDTYKLILNEDRFLYN